MLALHTVLNQSGLITHNKKCCHFCFLLFSGRVESRDNICIIEHHLIDRTTHVCIWQSFIFLLLTCSEIDHPRTLFYWIIGDPCLNLPKRLKNTGLTLNLSTFLPFVLWNLSEGRRCLGMFLCQHLAFIFRVVTGWKRELSRSKQIKIIQQS